jgi:Peptidase family M23
MGAPKLTLDVEPTSGDKLYYQAQAPSYDGGDAAFKIIVCMRITNKEKKKIRVTQIGFHFPGTNRDSWQMKAETKAMVIEGSDKTGIEVNGFLDSGQTGIWCNGTVDLTDDDDPEQVFNHVVLSGSAPKKISIHVKCDGFSEVAKKEFDLVKYTNPTDEGAFLFPFSVADMGTGEYFVTRGEHWADGRPYGLQIYALDISLQGIDDGFLSKLKPGITNAKRNEDFRIWNTPVRAVADGTIEEAWDDSPNNVYTGDGFPDNPPTANHVWVKHGNMYVYYTHLIKGSIPDHLKPVSGEPQPFIRAGEELGRAGNSGNASEPHTHIHCAHGSTDGDLRPIVFRKARILAKLFHNPPGAKDWVTLNAEGIPTGEVSIWPESTWPGNKVPTAGLTVRGDWKYKFWQSDNYDEFEAKGNDYFDKGYLMTYASSFIDNEHRRWVGIARESHGGVNFWISPDWTSFVSKVDSHLANDKRLIHVHAFQDGNDVNYFGLVQTGDWKNSCWRSDSIEEFSEVTHDLAQNKGKALVHISNIVVDGTRRWIGIAREASYKTEFFIANSLTEFLRKLEDYEKEGRHCIHMFPYSTADEDRWAGIVRHIDGPVEMWQNTNWDSFNEVVRYAQASQGRRLVGVEFPYQN